LAPVPFTPEIADYFFVINWCGCLSVFFYFFKLRTGLSCSYSMTNSNLCKINHMTKKYCKCSLLLVVRMLP